MSAAARAWYARIIHLYRPPQLRPLRRYIVQLHPILGYLPIGKHVHVAIIYRDKIVDFITRINVAITLMSADYNVLSAVPLFVSSKSRLNLYVARLARLRMPYR